MSVTGRGMVGGARRPLAGRPGGPERPPRPPVSWELVALADPLRDVPLDRAAVADGHRLTISRLSVSAYGARLTFSLEPPWMPPGLRPGRAPLPLPEGLATDPAGARYTIVPGASEGDSERLTGELLLQPPPPPGTAWLDVVLTMGPPRRRPGPLWRLRLPLAASEDAAG
ncbi:MAG TPA: hypothetical protein VFW92_01965 [Candidatus Limnocylindrales bacterium]|nr:hypothetical protein [Candidatus Limnocylindrales bacterium]